jgi:DNA-binding NarL/FixJ family response regulator
MENTPSEKKLRILMLEDSPADAELVENILGTMGIGITTRRVDSEGAFRKALEDFSPEIILSDYSLPGFDGASALATVLDRLPGVPFIFVTGALGEERAVDLLKRGATDFVLKTRLPRLPLCVMRALEEVDEKRRREQAEQDLRSAHAELELKVARRTRELRQSMEALRESETRFRTLSENLRSSEEALKQTNEQLEQRVRDRTDVLAHTIQTLQGEVAHRRKAEEELRRINEQLNLRAVQLRALAGELTMTEQRERKRFSRLLHDGLQQHLAAIKLQLGFILKELGQNEIGRAAAKIDRMLAESMQMSRSLSADLSPPVLHEGGLTPGLVWLARWMREKHDFQVDLIADEISKLPEDMTVLLFESLRELLFNAVKHAQVSEAEVRVERMDATGIRISVSDEGVGFDPHRLHPAGDIDGGFGLFSIRERLGLIGGNLEIRSVPGEGSKFTLSVPHAPASIRGGVDFSSYASSADNQEAAASCKEQPPTLQVLIVDDHAIFRDGIAQLLTQERGIQVVGFANDGGQAIELARKLQPDAILMDISMPGINGIEATRIIHQELPEIRIIGLSMYADEESAHVMREAGAIAYKSKGCAPAELVSAIRACC